MVVDKVLNDTGIASLAMAMIALSSTNREVSGSNWTDHFYRQGFPNKTRERRDGHVRQKQRWWERSRFAETKCEGCGTKPMFSTFQYAATVGVVEIRRVPALSKLSLVRRKRAPYKYFGVNFLDLCSSGRRTTIMSILLYLSITWVTLCVLLVGLVLISLLIVERKSSASQAMIADERISEQPLQLAKLDLAVAEPVQKARELADACGALARLEGTATLAPGDAIQLAARTIPDRTQHTGAVIIRDPRLTRARTLSDQSSVGVNATFVSPAVCGGRDTAA
jgi:hypothetical protein